MDPSCGIGRASGLIQGGRGHVRDAVDCQADNESTLFIGAEKICPRGIVYRIGDVDGRRQVHVAGTDHVNAVNVHVGNTHSQVVRDFPFQIQARLLYAGSLKVMRERGDIGLLKLSKRGRRLRLCSTSTVPRIAPVEASCAIAAVNRRLETSAKQKK
jgi:hypothetical protein